MRRLFSRLFIAFLASLLCHGVAAQYPSRPIHLLVPIPPGGGPDIVARLIAPKLGDALGQPVVVENRVGGNGSQHHLTMERLKARAGINMVHVPYKGGAPATTATVAGEVAVMMSGTSTAPQIKAGRLRALAFTGPQRSRILPDVPAIAEFYPDLVMVQWYGLFAPAGTPEAVLARLRAEVNKALLAPDIKEKLTNAGGVEPWITTPAEFAAELRSQFATYAKLVKDVGAKID